MVTQASSPSMPDMEMQQCIKQCEQCHKMCQETLMDCIQQGGDHAAPDHLRVMMDCIQICHTSADFMMRSSPLHHHTCAACAAVCDACAKDCAAVGSDERMRACAEVCRRCAESCERMAGQGAGRMTGFAR